MNDFAKIGLRIFLIGLAVVVADKTIHAFIGSQSKRIPF